MSAHDTAVPGLDHVIVTAAELETAIAEFERISGVRAVRGGQHPEHGTVNALVSMGASYIELFARATSSASPSAELALIDYAIRVDDLEDMGRRLAAAGLPFEWYSGSRLTPTGERLTWEGLEPDRQHFAGALPFFINWGTAPNPAATAPGGVTEPRLQVAHPEAERLRAIYRTLGIAIEVLDAPEPRLKLTARGLLGRFALEGDARSYQAVVAKGG